MTFNDLNNIIQCLRRIGYPDDRAVHGLVQSSHFHDAFANRGHLDRVIGRDDRCNDIAPESGSYLQKDIFVILLHIAYVGYLKVRTIGGQTAQGIGSHSRRNIAPHERRPEKHDTRLVLFYKLAHDPAIGHGLIIF